MAKMKKEAGFSLEWNDRMTCPVRFAENVFAEENATLANLLKEVTGCEKPRVMLVADANVVQRTEGLGTRIGKYVQTHGIALAGAPVVMAGGEKIKCDNFQSAQRILMAALETNIGVSDVMLVLGGGSLLDVAGYAATQVRGGVKLVRIPTTIAAMLDGAFASEAALDAPSVKDAIRLVCRPSAVLIDPSFAQTILDGVWRGGLGEAIRHAAVCDGVLLRKLAKNAEALRNRDLEVLTETVSACVESRMKKGSTAFALWSALQLEAMSGYKLPHGYAVPIGICVDCAYAVARGFMTKEDQDLVCRVLTDCGALEGLVHSQHLLQRPLDVVGGIDAWQLATGREALVMPNGIGQAQIEKTPDRAIFAKVLKEFYAPATKE